MDVSQKMIVLTQVSFIVWGEHFTPSKVPAQYTQSHDPGAIGTLGKYRGVPTPYGSADFDVPEEEEDKIAYVHKRAFPFIADMRAAGAEDFCLRITYHYENQCSLAFSREEQRMILDLDCDFHIDCWATDEERG